MKNLFSRLRGPRVPAMADSALSTSLLPADEAAAPAVGWPQRAAELNARPIAATEAARQLLQLWRGDAPLAALGDAAVPRLARWLGGAVLGNGQEPIRQDEAGDFLLVVLDGRLAVERHHAAGTRTPLFEARPGDLLGEMALFDGGPRFGACRCLGPCTVAVLDSRALQHLMAEDAPLAAALLASMTRRLSLRLRQTGARLSALLTPQ